MPPIEDRIEKYVDPNAPKVFDRTIAQRAIRTGKAHFQHPLAAVVVPLVEQLECAIAILDGAGTSTTEAKTEAMRYQKEAETANAEVKTMQGIVMKAREDLAAANRQLKALKPAPVKKRGPKAKIVPITEKKAAS